MRSLLVLGAIGASIAITLGLGSILLDMGFKETTFALIAREFSFNGLGYEAPQGGPTITVKVGEVVRLIVKNAGVIDHELIVVTGDVLWEAIKEPRALHYYHPEPAFKGAMIEDLLPGETKIMRFQVDRAGVYYYACLQSYPDSHIRLGMFGRLVVRA